MVDWIQVVTLALIQGLSEFLPISSSAHLVLPSQLLGWPDQGLLFDIAVHVGTLSAVLAYFWRDLMALLGDVFPRYQTPAAHPGELWRLAAATVPAVLAGLLLSDVIEGYLRGLGVIAANTILFGLLLGLASKRTRLEPEQGEEAGTVGWRDALLIGAAQMLALMPGVSRSGITITAGLLLGYTPATSARFSFLLSVPVILGAMVFLAADVLQSDALVVPLSAMLAAMAVSAISAYTTIALFLRLLARIGIMPFVWYRLILGAALIVVIAV